MESYTLREAAKKLGIPPRTLKQWEKEYAEFLVIPRTNQGARIYTNELLHKCSMIKEWSSEKRTKQEIHHYLKTEQTTSNHEDTKVVTSKPRHSPTQSIETKVMEGEVIDASQLPCNDTHYMVEQTIEQIAKRVKEEFAGEMKQQTAEALQQIIAYIAEIKEDTASVKQNIHQSINEWTGSLKQETHHMCEQLEEIMEFLHDEYERREKERKQYEERIMEREKSFRELVLSFRQAASANGKRSNKWWKFW
ncbi:MerR family transcriptional regulator [Thermaerobacillus caldiproteolyticus]|uniref:MerR family transcriptional regulator n=1 Tax=Thermaerobacillus caldiproteolyticus TaxID=247480 RepID=UPI00188A01AC|nr:MerR family transcriptional regulator [Anoxybacillus caldiproteolyticus]QPA32517.1 MerR family transcriptional regulator [Anoxybacillus caldiproteolyticus]